MKLTALEIKKQKFEKTLRGFDPAEVQAFLNLVSNEWEHLVTKNRDLEQKISDYEKKLEHYERVEEALHETLETAKSSAETKIEQARVEAQHKIEKAEMEADSIVREATQQRQQIRQSIIRLLDRRQEIIGGIRSYLDMAQDSIDRFSEDGGRLFSLPEKAHELPEESEVEEDEAPKIKPQNLDMDPENTTLPPGTDNIDDLVDDLE